MAQKIVLIGNAISADIMHAYLTQDDRYEIVAFSVDKAYITEDTKHGLPVVPTEEIAEKYAPADHKIILAIGYTKQNQIRQDLFKRCKEMGYEIETYIHPSAKIYNGGKIGEGSIIMPNSVLEVYTEIGQNTTIWANCLIGHHSIVGDNCWIASGTVLAGQTKIGDNCFCGVNVTISNEVSVAAFNIIGGNTAIHKCTKENEVYISGQGEKHRFPADAYAEHFLK